ncbi:RHS repeat-associated core domain-containing protein, partial [Xenorhabdus szentirmaii]
HESYTPLACIVAKGAVQDYFWYHTDINSAPLEVTDEDGKIAWSGKYDAFGAVNSTTMAYFTDTERSSRNFDQNLRYAGQYFDKETGLHFNTYRYYAPEIGRFISPDPIGLNGGINLYQYAPNPLGWVDPLGLNSKKCQYVYRELSVEDRIRFDAGLSIQPKGTGGTIAAHVDGKPTGFVSVAEVRDATERFSSGSGLVRIDVKKATQNGATYIPHKNVMQTVNSQGSLQNRKDAKRAVEGLFKGEIPHKAIELIK